jgi:hypothetical protein
MPRYETKTKKSPEDAIKAAIKFFGEGGLGLDTEEQEGCCAFFEGGGGFVRVTANQEGDRTTVDLETREWDIQVKHFMQKIS